MRIGRRCLGVALMVGGCSVAGENPSRTSIPVPDLRPVVDGAPYLCDFVPEQSFRRITGVAIKLSPEWGGRLTRYGLCLAYAQGHEAPLGVNWSFTDGEHILQ